MNTHAPTSDVCRKRQYQSLRRKLLAIVNCELHKAEKQPDNYYNQLMIRVCHLLRNNADNAYVTVSADDPTRIAYSPLVGGTRVGKYDHSRRRVTTLGRYLRPHFADATESELEECVRRMSAHTSQWTAILHGGCAITEVYENETQTKEKGKYHTGSCMAGGSHVGIYAANPKHVACLTMTCGSQYLRRLIWYCNDKVCLDRVFSAGGLDLLMAEKIADNWCKKQFAGKVICHYKDWPPVEVALDWSDLSPMPYLDSMAYGKYDGSHVHLRNTRSAGYDRMDDVDGDAQWSHLETCENCGGRFDVATMVATGERRCSSSGNEYYCADCGDGVLSTCDNCGALTADAFTAVLRAPSTNHPQRWHPSDVCEDCLSYFSQCELSGDYYPASAMTEVIVRQDRCGFDIVEQWGPHALEESAIDDVVNGCYYSMIEHQRREMIKREKQEQEERANA